MQEELFLVPSRKMVTKLVRHFDQDERQTDAAVHWDSIRPVLLKAFADMGASEFSEQAWIQHIHKGSIRSDSSIFVLFTRLAAAAAAARHSTGEPWSEPC